MDVMTIDGFVPFNIDNCIDRAQGDPDAFAGTFGIKCR